MALISSKDSVTAAGKDSLIVIMRMDGNDGTRWGDHTAKNFYSSFSHDSGLCA